jgi:hypothetical protein
LEGVLQLIERERLDQGVANAEPKRVNGEFFRTMLCEQNKGNVGVLLPERRDVLDAVCIGQVAIKQHQINGVVSERRLRGSIGVGCPRSVPKRRQPAVSQHMRDIMLIVNNQDLFHITGMS